MERNVNVASATTEAVFDDGRDNKCMHVDRLDVNQLDPVGINDVLSSKCNYRPTIVDLIVMPQ